NGSTSASATPSLTSGTLVSGDTATFTESYDTATAGTGKTLTPAATVTDSGSAKVTADYALTLAPVETGTINPAHTSHRLSSSPNPSATDQAVTFTATLTANSPGAGIPTGTVTFVDGISLIGTGVLNGSGVASYSTTSLTAGNHPIAAI